MSGGATERNNRAMSAARVCSSFLCKMKHLAAYTRTKGPGYNLILTRPYIVRWHHSPTLRYARCTGHDCNYLQPMLRDIKFIYTGFVFNFRSPVFVSPCTFSYTLCVCMCACACWHFLIYTCAAVNIYTREM